MRRAPGIGNRHDGAEGDAPGGVGLGVTEALEARVARRMPAVAGMQIDAVGVALPDLDPGARDRPRVGVHHAPGKMQDISARLAHRALDADQVGIIVAGHAYRVERALAGVGRRRQRCQRRPRHQQRRSRENERAARQTTPLRVTIAHHVVLLRLPPAERRRHAYHA